MRLLIPYTYTESVVPPRCRKALRVQMGGSMAVTVYEPTEQEAPVAIIQRSTGFTGDADQWGEWGPVIRTFRWHAGKLWTRLYHRDLVSRGEHRPVSIEELMRDSPPSGDYGWYQSKQERRTAMMRWARSTMVLNGEVWKVTGEPRYVVMTFGLGCNHARRCGTGCGTAICTDNGYNSNIGKSRYFRTDQREQAVAEANRVAAARGDTEDLPVSPSSEFDILIPEAVRLNPGKEHSNGNPFINRVEGIIEAVKHPTIAAFGAMALALKE